MHKYGCMAIDVLRSSSHMAQESIGIAMDPDTLFVIAVLICVLNVFGLGVAAGCGCFYWRQRATVSGWHTQRYKIEITGETQDHPEIRRRVKERPSPYSPLINALSLEASQFEFAVGPGKAFRTKEQLKRALEASKDIGTRPDTSRVVKKSAD